MVYTALVSTYLRIEIYHQLYLVTSTIFRDNVIFGRRKARGLLATAFPSDIVCFTKQYQTDMGLKPLYASRLPVPAKPNLSRLCDYATKKKFKT